MKVLSLFDGIACGYEALKRAKVPVSGYYASEIDKYAIQIAKKNHPDIKQLGDVREFSFLKMRFDLLIGGSPCQGFSFAGKQLNFDDPRSRLFFEYVRILKEVRPKYFLLENVKMKKEYQDVISKQLGVDPIEINSALFSAQNRVRLYWTNIPNIQKPPIDSLWQLRLEDVIECGYVDRSKSYCIDANYWKGGDLNQYFNKKRRQVVFESKTNLQNYRKLTPVECERLQTLPDNYTAGVSNTQRYKMLGNAFTVDVLAYIFRYIPENKESHANQAAFCSSP